MSLIQDALKRQQQETGQAAPEETKPPVQQPANTPLSLRKSPAQNVPPATPPPIPAEAAQNPPEAEAESPQQESTDSSKKRLKLIIAAVVLIIVLAGGGTWAFLQFMSPKPATPSPPVEVKQQPSDKVPAAASVTVPAVVPTATNEVPKQPLTATPDALPPQQTQTVATTTSPTPQQAEAAKMPEPPTEPPVVTAPPAEEPPVSWPSLVLTGVVGKGANGSAIINKQIVAVGETIDGVKIVAIKDKSVELEFKGKTQILKVGGTTN
ncbi:MAG: hypothetical protein PHR77_08325 [Kiritimatiellae bacterium]|nr:hypothetical protein [Kiritimatiellia bacterium]MDD5522824.1 hypothetical protein [Kiritimatiellia bacterium]